MFPGLILPVCLGLLIFDLLRRWKPSFDLREIILIDAIVLGVVVVISTESLSLFHALTTGGAICWWGTACLLLGYVRTRFPSAPQLNAISRARRFFQGAGVDSIGMLFVLAFFAITLLLIALYATPNNYDSMTYHLARMAHWQQEQSISFFGTRTYSQNRMPPWAEWAMLQLTLLQGDDRLVNLVQWFSYIGCIVGASLITERSDGSRRAGIIAALFVATLPGAIFEATSTQNDLVMSLWLICSIYGCLKLSQESDKMGALILGTSLGLGLLTKTVTLLFAFPLGVWAVWTMRNDKFKIVLLKTALVGLIILGINGGHLARNLITSGHLLGPVDKDPTGSYYTNATYSPGAIFSNIVRNLSLHACFFHEGSVPTDLVVQLHHALGLDPEDPRTTCHGSPYSIRDWGEDGAPMPLHLAVIGISFLAILLNRHRFSFASCALTLSILAGAFLFCLILKWQPFHARLHLALFIMAAPVAGLALGGLFWRSITWIILVVLLITAVPNVLFYTPRAALGPFSVFVTPSDFQQLFRQPQLIKPYQEAKEILEQAKVQEVGLVWENDDKWEYPLLVSDHLPLPWRTDHVLIENAYTPLETTRVPDALLCNRLGLGEIVTTHGQRYRLAREYVQGPTKELVLSIYFPDNAEDSPKAPLSPTVSPVN